MSTPFPMMFAIVVLSTGAVRAAMPSPDVSGAPWFNHCRALSADRKTLYPSASHANITYAWQSDLGYLWNWENGEKASDAMHYCTRTALYNRKGHLFANITMLCSVEDRGKSTEVWTLGNAAMARRLCPTDNADLNMMDAKAARR